MTPSARLQAVIELLTLLEASQTSADVLLAQYSRERRYIGSTDRRAINGLFYTVLRNRGALNWFLTRAGLVESPRTHVMAVLALTEGLNADEIATAFDGGKYGTQPLAAEEKEALGKIMADMQSGDSSAMPFWARVNVPEWLGEKLQAQYGAETEPLLEALSGEAPVDLRVNTLKADVERAFGSLLKEGIDASPCPLSPIGLRIKERQPLGGTQALREGWIEPMDEGSQLVALAINAQPGELIVDYCAGAGGKTLALAAMMQGKGKILAHDVDAGRLRELQRRAERAGCASMIEIVPGDGTNDKLDAYVGKADRVIVDAPCSGSGTWRRNPELRWRYSQEDLRNFSQLQATLLSSAARLLTSGGKLFYITCSLIAQENQEQMNKPGIPLMDFFPCAIDNLLSDARLSGASNASAFFQLLPHTHRTDGFFIAAWEKR